MRSQLFTLMSHPDSDVRENTVGPKHQKENWFHVFANTRPYIFDDCLAGSLHHIGRRLADVAF